MKTNFLKTWLTMLMLVFGMGVTWGETKTFTIDFYDSSKLSSTNGTGLTNNNYSQFVKVEDGLNATSVVTRVTTAGTIQFGKNGGLTFGTGTASASTANKVTFTIGNDYAVKSCTVYAAQYEDGRFLLNGNAASSGSAASKGSEIDNVTNPFVWTSSTGLTSLEFTKDNGSGNNQKRLTIYRIVCEYETSGGTSSVAAPTFDVTAGTYTEDKTVKVSNYDATLSYYYTTDGTEPTETSTAYVHTDGVTITSSCTLKMIAYKGSDKSSVASAAYVINKPIVFTSLEELVAADLTSGQLVNVSFENVPIKSIYTTSQSKRTGIYFDIQKGGHDIEIYYSSTEVPEEWEAGGTLSGTMTNCPWTYYERGTTWELAPEKDTWAWSNLTYTAPVQKTITALSVSGTPTKTTYNVGDAFETAGLTVTATYNDQTSATITTGFEWDIDYGTGNEALVAGTTSVDVMAYIGQDIMSEVYTVNGLTVNVPVTLTSIVVSGTPTKTTYYTGDAFDTTGLVVTGTYSDSHQETITEGLEWTIDPETLAEGTTSVDVIASVGSVYSEVYTVNGLTVTKPDFETATYVFSTFTSDSSVELTDLEGFLITLNKGEGTTNPAWNAGASEARIYAKGSLTVKANNATIKSIEYDYVVNANKNNIVPTIAGVEGTTDKGTWDAENKTWTGADDEVTFSTSGSAGNIGFTKLVIKYVESSKIETSLAWSAAEATVTIGANDNVFPTLTTTPADLTGVTYESSNTSVATIAADGTITLVKAGETTITAKYEGDAEHASATPASYTLTVVKAPFVPTPVEEGYETVNFTEVYSSLTGNATETIEEYEGTSFAMAFAKPQNSPTPTKYYANGTSVRAYTGNTITINGAENITAVDIAWADSYVDDAVSISGIGTTTAVVTFSKTCRFTAITVKYQEMEVERTTPKDSYGTICLPFDAIAEGAVVLTMGGKNEAGNIVFEYTTENESESISLEAGVPYLYRATADVQKFTAVEGGSTVTEAGSENGFVGTFTKIENISGYFLYTVDNKFHQAGVYVNVGANKCYIPNMEDVGSYTPANSRAFVSFGVFDDETTGINTVNFESVVSDGKYMENENLIIVKNGVKYNLNGIKK